MKISSLIEYRDIMAQVYDMGAYSTPPLLFQVKLEGRV